MTHKELSEHLAAKWRTNLSPAAVAKLCARDLGLFPQPMPIYRSLKNVRLLQ